MSFTPQDHLASGDPAAALQVLQQQVREHPADVKLRIFLFQLLCVLGQWERAANQLQVCGEMDAGTLAMVNTYREALKCEALRAAVFAGKTTPMVFGQPQPWVALLIEALQAEGRGERSAASLRQRAFDEAPAASGHLQAAEGEPQPFAWIADADSRLGPVLEAVINGRYCWVPFTALSRIDVEPPEDLRDLVWAPVHLQFVNGGETVALVPTRYAGTEAETDGALRLSRRTEWLEIGPEQYRGLGQRVLTTDVAELGLLELRQLSFDPQPQADHQPDAGSP